ncbi:hypothetical protein [Sporosarcina ureae]|uniref:hypothetical protein n=1 Tax=Sporosarcina ureae TaxID=1571 RepID=UPI0026F2EDC4|nr:hypothetical protein [Sporosarcina ureae]
MLTIKQQGNRTIYTINNATRYNAIESLPDEVINECKKFAFDMSFGKEGEHRATRSGGKNSRKNGEIFCDAFNGKLGEFAFWRYSRKRNLELPRPDLDTFKLGKWDESDFVSGKYNLAVKTTKSIGNLLLLEEKDWDEKGTYIPNKNKPGAGIYHAIVLVRLDSDITARFRSAKKYFNKNVSWDELEEIFEGFSSDYDIPGYVNLRNLRRVIQQEHVIKQGGYLGTSKTKMDATNYYIQTGNLMPIDNLLHALVNDN